jgi:hypothetical protein
MKLRRLLVACVFLLGACSQSQPLASAVPSNIPASAIASAAAVLADDVKTWCTNHTGGPGADQHQVEDMAVKLGVVPGAKTREDVFGRWAGRSGDDPDPTYVTACLAAFAEQAASGSGGSSQATESHAPSAQPSASGG